VSSAAVISDSDSVADVKPKTKVKKADHTNGKGKVRTLKNMGRGVP
jgi:hypothetical protein